MTGKQRVIEVLRREGASADFLSWLETVDGNMVDNLPDDFLVWFLVHIGSHIFHKNRGYGTLAETKAYYEPWAPYQPDWVLRRLLRGYKKEIGAWFDNYDLGDSSDES